jgi:hypothetical protein
MKGIDSYDETISSNHIGDFVFDERYGLSVSGAKQHNLHMLFEGNRRHEIYSETWSVQIYRGSTLLEYSRTARDAGSSGAGRTARTARDSRTVWN